MAHDSRARVMPLIACVCTLVVSACSPQGPQGAASSAGSGSTDRPAAPRKVLTVADAYEATGIIETFITQKAQRTESLTRRITHENLVVTPRINQYEPQ